MRSSVSRRTVFTTSILVAGASLLAPSAQATQWVDTSAVVDQANASLSQFGVTLDRAAAEQFDSSVNANIDATLAPYVTPVQENSVEATQQSTGQVTEQALAFVDEAQQQVQRALPNYQVRTDIQAQMMAATPGEVLHRVPGSWFNAPAVPEESHTAEAGGKSLYGPGTPIYLRQDSMCTLAVTGTDADGRKIGITAGHCGEPGDAVRSADSFWVGESGTIVSNGTNDDYSVIEFGSNAELSNSYNGTTVNEVGGRAVNGQEVCKTGVATGYTCGIVWSADQRMTMSQLCAMQGDSGAPVLANGRLVGIISGGVLPNYDLACQTPLQGPIFMPSLSVNMDQILQDMNALGGPGEGFRPTAG